MFTENLATLILKYCWMFITLHSPHQTDSCIKILLTSRTDSPQCFTHAQLVRDKGWIVGRLGTRQTAESWQNACLRAHLHSHDSLEEEPGGVSCVLWVLFNLSSPMEKGSNFLVCWLALAVFPVLETSRPSPPAAITLFPLSSGTVHTDYNSQRHMLVETLRKRTTV